MQRLGPLLTIIAAVLAVVVLSIPQTAQAGEDLILRVGETKTIFLGRIKNVQVGDPSIIEVQEIANKKGYIAVFGLKEGYSSLIVGDLTYDVTVVGDIERLRKDIETLLLDIPGVDVLTAGDRVVVDGVVKRRDDFDRIQLLVESNKAKVFSLVLLDERDIVRRAQIQLHFQVLEINRNLSHDIGLNWNGSGPVRLVLDTISYVQFGPGSTVGPGSDPVTGIDEGTITRTPDDLFNFKSTTDVRRVLDKDFFTTISGEEVEFFRGKELVFVAEGFNGQIITKQVGLLVKVRAVIDDDGDIDMEIEITFATVGSAEFGGSVPAINTQFHKAHVQLREGESFALSGFFRREKGRVLSGLPGLKDIPGLGVLFGSRAWQKGETDGIIVLTPVLIDPQRRSMKKQIKETLDIYDAADVKW
jgi:pilus assembly protein CpaC